MLREQTVFENADPEEPRHILVQLLSLKEKEEKSFGHLSRRASDWYGEENDTVIRLFCSLVLWQKKMEWHFRGTPERESEYKRRGFYTQQNWPSSIKSTSYHQNSMYELREFCSHEYFLGNLLEIEFRHQMTRDTLTWAQGWALNMQFLIAPEPHAGGKGYIIWCYVSMIWQ